MQEKPVPERQPHHHRRNLRPRPGEPRHHQHRQEKPRVSQPVTPQPIEPPSQKERPARRASRQQISPHSIPWTRTSLRQIRGFVEVNCQAPGDQKKSLSLSSPPPYPKLS